MNKQLDTINKILARVYEREKNEHKTFKELIDEEVKNEKEFYQGGK